MTGNRSAYDEAYLAGMRDWQSVENATLAQLGRENRRLHGILLVTGTMLTLVTYLYLRERSWIQRASSLLSPSTR